MSATLLTRVKMHIVDDGGLLSGFTVKYYRWSDTDLNGTGSIALFKMAGTSGEVSYAAQFHDVSLYLMADPDEVVAADSAMLAVLQYLRAEYKSTNVFSYYPLASYSGPMYLDNGRAMFEMVIRCGVTDH